MAGARVATLRARLSGIGGSRRRLGRDLMVGAGAGLAALLRTSDGRFGPSAAAAGASAICRATSPTEFVSKRACQELACGARDGCLCVQTVGHVPTCVANFDPRDRRDCPARDECNKRRRCRNGFVCAKVEGCCGNARRACLRRCPR